MSRDKKYVWHPFTKQLNAPENLEIVRGEGIYLHTREAAYMDLISSWWVNLHGHSHPYINQKITEQIQKLEHVLFSGFTHAPAVDLAERLIGMLPGKQEKIFYSDNGSTAVEVGLKMALQYWKNKGEERTIFFAFEGAYHGDTFGAMSVGARNVFNEAFERLLFDVKHVPLPDENNLGEIKALIKQIAHSGKVAGFIFEPLVQGAAGMRMYQAEHLNEIMKCCHEHDVLCIADEVMTGFGRTGTLFAGEQMNEKPDIICLSKGLTGGYFPLGVTACTGKIYSAFVDEDDHKTFFHGHSYTANPLACTAALASLDLLQKEECLKRIKAVSQQHQKFADEVRSNRNLTHVRVCGTIIAFELVSAEGNHYLNPLAEKISSYFLSRKMIVRPLGNVFYLIPPYCISAEDLERVYTEIRHFIS